MYLNESRLNESVNNLMIYANSSGVEVDYVYEYFEGIYNSSFQVTNVEKVIPMNRQKAITSSRYTHTLGSDNVTILKDGTYDFKAHAIVSIASSAGGARGAPRLTLQKFSSGTWTDVQDVWAREYTREYVPISGDLNLETTETVSAGDVYRCIVVDDIAAEPDEDLVLYSKSMNSIDSSYLFNGTLYTNSSWPYDNAA